MRSWQVEGEFEVEKELLVGQAVRQRLPKS